MSKIWIFTFLAAASVLRTQTIGLISQAPGSRHGYVLFAPLPSKITYLIDKCGRQVHTWKSSRPPGQSVYLLPDGGLLRTCNDSSAVFPGGGGRLEKLDWDSKVIWSYNISDSAQRQHHDICALPNGNILVLVWEKKSAAEAVRKGRNPKLLGDLLWSEKIIELKPEGKNSAAVVWEWHIWDHLIQDFDPGSENYGVIADHPELININYQASISTDWLHFNSIAYNAELDQVMISNRNFCEVFILDHSTSRTEAASHTGGKYGKGGDLLYRWGNAAAYNTGRIEDQKLFRQHNAHWIGKGLPDEGKIMIFNNGLDRPEENYSSVEIIHPPLDEGGLYKRTAGQPYLPDSSDWIYKNKMPALFYSKNVSGAQRLLNGNTLICEGAKGKFFEIDKDQKIVWTYISPVIYGAILQNGQRVDQNQVFRCSFYEPDYRGFKRHSLKPGKPIELRTTENN